MSKQNLFFSTVVVVFINWLASIAVAQTTTTMIPPAAKTDSPMSAPARPSKTPAIKSREKSTRAPNPSSAFSPSSIAAKTPYFDPAEPKEIVLTLQDAIKKGLEYSPDLAGAESKVKGAVGGTDKSKGSLFPTINAVAGAQTRQNTGVYTTQTSGPLTSLVGETYTVGLTLNQPLYAGGGLVAGIDFFKAGEEIARQGYFSAKLSVLQSIITAFFALAQSEELLDAAAQNKQLLKAYLDVTLQYERIGRSREMDKLQAQVNHSIATTDVMNNQVLVTNANANLNRYLGMPVSQPIKADYKVTISPIGEITTDQAFETALKNNPTLKQQQILREQVDYTEALDLSQDNTSLNLTSSFGLQSPDRTKVFSSDATVWTVGLNLTVPLFSGFSSYAKRRVYTETKVQAEKTLVSSMDQTRAAIRAAVHLLHTTEPELFVALDAVKEGRAALDLANKGYKQGIVAATDVVSLQLTRYNAEKIFINTQYIYLNNLVNLRQAMGIDLEKAYGSQ